MNLFGKLLIALFLCFSLFILAFLIAPPESQAGHICPNWGISTSDTGSPGGLIVRTENTRRVLLDGISFTLSATHSSLVNVTSGGGLIENISSGNFATGSPINCGSLSETHAGYAVFGFGSSSSAGNNWILGCKQVTGINTSTDIIYDNGVNETFTISNIEIPAGNDGYWTATIDGVNLGRSDTGISPFRVTNGGNRGLVLTFHGYTNTLNVRSSPDTGVAITGSQAGTGGTTNYTVTKSSELIGTSLDAPLSAGGRDFVSWTGCDSTLSGGIRCKIRFGGGQTKTVTANYKASMADLVITSVRFNSPTATYLPGETVKPIIAIKNQGGSTAYPIGQSSFTTIYRGADFTSCKPEGSQERFNLSSLAPGAVDTFGDNEGVGFPAPSSPGIYTLYVMVDSTSILNPVPAYCAVPESNEKNNRTTARYTVAAPAGPACSISALPTSILPGESSTLSWDASANTASAVLSAADIGDPQAINTSPALPSGSQVVTPSVTTTYYLTVTDQFGQQGECGVTVTLEVPEPQPEPEPEPEPEPQSPPPEPQPPEVTQIRPNPCEDAVETDKLTDNYVTDLDGSAPIELNTTITKTGRRGELVTVELNQSYPVDFSQLQALFGYTNSDYLEGRFQDPAHKTADLFSLESAKLNSWRGPEQKSTPKLIIDEMKRKYVEYVYTKRDAQNRLSLPESADTIADIAGQNPKTITELVADYGMPFPPQPGQDRSAWLASWGKYWEKIPTSYNELYKGKLEFAVVGGEKAYQEIQAGQGCAAYVARTVEFNVPDFGRTTLVSDALNQTVVPYAAQSFRDHRTEAQGVGQAPAGSPLAKVLGFCKKIIVDTPAKVLEGLRKVVKITLDFLTPVKTAYAQEENVNTCIKIAYPGKEGVAPYCAVSSDQLIAGDSCTTNKISVNKLNTENPNVECNLVIGSVQAAIGDDRFWDSCTDNGDGTLTCTTSTVRIYPNFRIPWLAEIWNNTLYSDSQEFFSPPVQGAKTGQNSEGEVLQANTGVNSPQQTGRPGFYQAFLPKVVFDELFRPEDTQAQVQQLIQECSADPDAPKCEYLKQIVSSCIRDPGQVDPSLGNVIVQCMKARWGKNLPGQAASDTVSDIRERFIGGTNCAKHGSRDLALKPDALQNYLGITSQCPVFAAAVTEVEVPPPPPGSGGIQPNQDNCGGKYELKNPLGNFGDPNCDFSKNGLYGLLKNLDPANADYWFNTIVPCESGYNPNAWLTGDPNAAVHSPDPAGAWGLFQMGRGKNGQYDHGDVIWQEPIPSLLGQAFNALEYNKLISGSFAYWACSY